MKYPKPLLKGKGSPLTTAVNISSKQYLSENKCFLCCWQTSSPDNGPQPTCHSRCSCPPCASNICMACSSLGTTVSCKGSKVLLSFFIMAGTAFPGLPRKQETLHDYFIFIVLASYQKPCAIITISTNCFPRPFLKV